MSQSHKDKLDTLLRSFAERQQADEQSLDRTRRQILAAASEYAGDSAPLRTSSPTRWWRSRAIWFTVGVAATLLVAFAGSVFLVDDGDPIVAEPDPDTVDPHAMAGISADQLARQSQLFEELDRLFGRQLNWFAESNGAIEVGVEPEPSAVSDADDSKLLSIRVTIVRRRRGQSNWDSVWSANLVSRSQRVVQFKPEADAPNLVVWAYVLPDGEIACDTELSTNHDGGLHTSTLELQSAGDVAEMASSEVGDVEYRVFQSVTFLNGGVI